MLTKTDLQAIDELMVKRVDQIVVRRINELVPKQIQKALKPINRKIDLVISFFDREYVALRKRVERIEDHLHISLLTS